GLEDVRQPSGRRADLPRRTRLEHRLEVKHTCSEGVEIARSHDRVAGNAGLASPGRDLGDNLAGQALLIELALAGDDSPGAAHPASLANGAQRARAAVGGGTPADSEIHDLGAGLDRRRDQLPGPERAGGDRIALARLDEAEAAGGGRLDDARAGRADGE